MGGRIGFESNLNGRSTSFIRWNKHIFQRGKINIFVRRLEEIFQRVVKRTFTAAILAVDKHILSAYIDLMGAEEGFVVGYLDGLDFHSICSRCLLLFIK